MKLRAIAIAHPNETEWAPNSFPHAFTDSKVWQIVFPFSTIQSTIMTFMASGYVFLAADRCILLIVQRFSSKLLWVSEWFDTKPQKE